MLILLFDQVTDFLKLDESVVRVVYNQKVHYFNNVVV